MSDGWKRHLNERGWVVPSAQIKWTRRLEKDDTLAALTSILQWVVHVLLIARSGFNFYATHSTFHNQSRSKLISMVVIEGDNLTSVMVLRLRYSTPSGPSDTSASQSPQKSSHQAYGYYVFDPEGYLKSLDWYNARFVCVPTYIDVLSILQGAFWNSSQPPTGPVSRRDRTKRIRPQLFTTYSAFLPATTSEPSSPERGSGPLPSSQSYIAKTPPWMSNAELIHSDAVSNATQALPHGEPERLAASLERPSMATLSANSMEVGTGSAGAFPSAAYKVKSEGSMAFRQPTPSRVEPSFPVPLGLPSDDWEQGEMRLNTASHPSPATHDSTSDSVPRTSVDVGTDGDAQGNSETLQGQDLRTASDLLDLPPSVATSPTHSEPQHAGRYGREVKGKGKGKALYAGFEDVERDRVMALRMEIFHSRARRLQVRMHEDPVGAAFEYGLPHDLAFSRARDGHVRQSTQAIKVAGHDETIDLLPITSRYDAFRPNRLTAASRSHAQRLTTSDVSVGEKANLANLEIGVPLKLEKELSSLSITEKRAQSTDGQTDATSSGSSPSTAGPPFSPLSISIAGDVENWKRLGDRRIQSRRSTREREQATPVIEVSPPSPARARDPQQPPLVPPKDLRTAGVAPSTAAHSNAGRGEESHSPPSGSADGNLLPPAPQAAAEDEGHSEGLLAILAHHRIRRPRSLNFLRHRRSSSASPPPPLPSHNSSQDSLSAPASGAGAVASTGAGESAGSGLKLSRLWHKHVPRPTASSLDHPSVGHVHRVSDPGPLPRLPLELAAQNSNIDRDDSPGLIDPDLVEALFPGYKADSADALGECGICMEDMPQRDMAIIPHCKHVFCYPCVRQYVSGRLQDGRLDMPCPSCAIDPNRGKDGKGEVSRDFIEYLALSTSEREALERLEMAEFAVLHRCPK